MAEASSKKITVCIPTYWTNETGLASADRLYNIYDHPTPINSSGTIERTLNSLQGLEGQFNVVIIGTITEPDLYSEFQNKLKKMLAKYKKLDTYWFSHDELTNFHRLLDKKDLSYQKKYASLEGYSNIRNLCLSLPHLLGSDLTILIDDDEVIADKNFIIKAKDFMGETAGEDNEKVLAKTGLYISEEEETKKIKTAWWERFWPKGQEMHKIFKKAMEGPRLSMTPVALGGAMVIHKELFQKASFDPWILRGEDIDYVINCKLLGHNFYMDNQLTFLHLPPEHPSHVLGMRQDIFRFIYEKEKIEYAFEQTDLKHFDLEELDPYPGRFLKRDVARRALSLSILTSMRDFYHADIMGHLKLIRISVWDALRYAKRNRSRWIGFQRLWPTFMEEIKSIKADKVLTKIG